MKYYLIAGERSGDLHAANLMKALQEHDPEAEFRYFGGDYMQAVGGQLVMHYREMAFMGFWEVLKNLGTIRKFLRQCRQDILAYNPDVVILVDYAGFNLKIAGFAKKHGFKAVYYISPKVWAWNTGRARKIKKLVDQMLCILPFEVDFYRRFDWQVHYVGNPVLEAVKGHKIDIHLKTKYQIPAGKPLIAVLPGSRQQEVAHILPVVEQVISQNTAWHFAVAGVNNLPAELYSHLDKHTNCTLVEGATYDLLAHADAAIVTSGTATLETALWNVPQVVVYKTSLFSYLIARAVVKVPYISLVNLIAGCELVKELIQHNCTAAKITAEVASQLRNPADYSLLQEALGDKVASREAAGLIAAQVNS